MACCNLFLVARSILCIKNLSMRNGSCPWSTVRLNLSYSSSLLSCCSSLLVVSFFISMSPARKHAKLTGCSIVPKFALGMMKQSAIFRDLGQMNYKAAWDYQESLLQQNVRIKTEITRQEFIVDVVTAPTGADENSSLRTPNTELTTKN